MKACPVDALSFTAAGKELCGRAAGKELCDRNAGKELRGRDAGNKQKKRLRRLDSFLERSP